MSEAAREQADPGPTDLLAVLDLTSLDPLDDVATVARVCDAAWAGFGGVRPAAVCGWPTFAGLIRARLEGSGVRTAVVAGGFPTGQVPASCKAAEVRAAVEAGAEEVDVVIRRGGAVGEAGGLAWIVDEVSAMREAGGPTCLKVILETAELSARGGSALVASVSGSVAGVLRPGDFLKTSTGFSRVSGATGATSEAAAMVLGAIRASGVGLGFKASGGIRTVDAARGFGRQVVAALGPGSVTPSRFRIGASWRADGSGLADGLARALLGGVGDESGPGG